MVAAYRVASMILLVVHIGMVRASGMATVPLSSDAAIAQVQLDAHPTPTSSVLFTFDDGGPTLRLPKVLFRPSDVPSDPGKAIKAESVGMTFWYPDMRPSEWNSTMDKYFEKQRGVYSAERDRFRVHILWMFYAALAWDDLSPGKWTEHGVEPRPRRMELNVYCLTQKDGRCSDATRRLPVGYPGIDMVVVDDWIKKHPKQSMTHSIIPRMGCM